MSQVIEWKYIKSFQSVKSGETDCSSLVVLKARPFTVQVHSDLAEAIGYFDWKIKKCGIRVVESNCRHARMKMENAGVKVGWRK